MVSNGHTEKVVFEQRLEGGRQASPVGSVSGSGNSKSKGGEMETCLVWSRDMRGPVAREQRGKEEERGSSKGGREERGDGAGLCRPS